MHLCECERAPDGARGSRPYTHVRVRERWMGHEGLGHALMLVCMRFKAMHALMSGKDGALDEGEGHALV